MLMDDNHASQTTLLLPSIVTQLANCKSLPAPTKDRGWTSASTEYRTSEATVQALPQGCEEVLSYIRHDLQRFHVLDR